MTKKSEVYKCMSCGCIATILIGGKGELTCCGQKMNEVTPDEAKKLVHGISRPGAP